MHKRSDKSGKYSFRLEMLKSYYSFISGKIRSYSSTGKDTITKLYRNYLYGRVPYKSIKVKFIAIERYRKYSITITHFPL